MEPSRFSSFEARPRPASSPPPERGDHGLAELRATIAHSRRRFITVNAVGWAVAVGAPTLAGVPMGAAVVGELTVGTLLIAMQSCLVLAASTRLDRVQDRAYGAWNDGRGAASSSVGGEGRR
jgi:hypothetical protein